MQRRTLVPVSTAATMATIVAAVTMVAIVATVATDASVRLVADVSTNLFFLTVVSCSSRLITMSVMMLVTMLNTYWSYVGLVVTVLDGHLLAIRRSSIGEQLTGFRSTVTGARSALDRPLVGG